MANGSWKRLRDGLSLHTVLPAHLPFEVAELVIDVGGGSTRTVRVEDLTRVTGESDRSMYFEGHEIGARMPITLQRTPQDKWLMRWDLDPGLFAGTEKLSRQMAKCPAPSALMTASRPAPNHLRRLFWGVMAVAVMGVFAGIVFGGTLMSAFGHLFTIGLLTTGLAALIYGLAEGKASPKISAAESKQVMVWGVLMTVGSAAAMWWLA